MICSFFRTSERKANENFTSEQKTNSVANEKRTAVDRLFWKFSKEVYFLCLLIRRDTRYENRQLWILKQKTIQNSEDNKNEKLYM